MGRLVKQEMLISMDSVLVSWVLTNFDTAESHSGTGFPIGCVNAGLRTGLGRRAREECCPAKQGRLTQVGRALLNIEL